MTKTISKLPVICLLILSFSNSSFLSAMEISPFPLDNLPTNLKLSILATVPAGPGSPRIPFVLRMMQVNHEFEELATDGHLWQQLAKMEGFSTHHSQAYQAHYQYHRALALLNRDPTHQDPNLLTSIIFSLNEGAALLHEGAVTQLINLMKSEVIPLSTPFIHLPQWLDLGVYPLLPNHVILKSSPEDIAQQYLKSGYTLIKNNERAKNQLYKYVRSKGLDYLTCLYDILISQKSWKEVKTKEIPFFLASFLKNAEKLMADISRAYRGNETLVLELMFNYAIDVKFYSELTIVPDGSNLITSEEYEQIRQAYSKAITKLTLFHSSENFNVIWDDRKIGTSVKASQKMNSYHKKEHSTICKAFESGKISPYWIDQLNELSQYLSPIVPTDGITTSHPIAIYASLLQQKLFIDYPHLCFSEEILGTHIYTDQLDADNPGYLGKDNYQGTILDLRRFLFWVCLAKQDNGPFYHHQCLDFFKEFDHNHLFFSGFSPQVLNFFNLGINGSQFYENYLGSSDKLDFLTCLSEHNHQKLIHLIDTDDQEDLAVIFEALSQSHGQRGEHETSLIDAQKAFDINPELYVGTLIDALLKLDRYDEAIHLLRSDTVRLFCDPEEIRELEISIRKEE